MIRGNKFTKFFLVILVIVIFSEGIIFVKSYIHSRKTNIASCSNFNLSNKLKCWEDQLDSTLKDNGIKEAFLVFDELYRAEPQFADNCHGHTHRLGEITYQLLIKGQDFDFPPQTAYCGYGFYHGLTELLIQTKGPKEAGKLCDSKKSEITKVLYDACYHGIGHGALSSSAKETQIWGNPQKMVEYALNLCDDSTEDLIEKFRCASGVFMELGDDFGNGQLSLDSIRDDPLAICRQQQEFGRMDCYTQMNGVLNMIGSGKLKESAKFIEAIEEDKYAIEAIITLAAPTIDITKTDFTEDITTCRGLQARLRLPCIKGLVLAFLLKGSPGMEYEQAINFCKQSEFSKDEGESCNELLLRHSRDMYQTETMTIICSKVQSLHKKDYCHN